MLFNSLKGSRYKAIEILCDGGDQFGYGHIRRSLSLADYIKKRGYIVTLEILSDTKVSSSNISLTENCQANIRIVDLPYSADRWIETSEIPVLALDYFGDATPEMTISIYEHNYPIPNGVRFSGLEYSIIRSEISQFRNHKATGDNVVVMIGGSDIRKEGEKISLDVAKQGVSVTLIEGPGVVEHYRINEKNINIARTPNNLSDLMASCDWAITNGGTSMLEMMCLGKPVHVVPQTRDELKLAELILNKNGILNVGSECIVIPDSEKKLTVSNTARKLVDGKGIERIVRKIEDIMNDFER